MLCDICVTSVGSVTPRAMLAGYAAVNGSGITRNHLLSIAVIPSLWPTVYIARMLLFPRGMVNVRPAYVAVRPKGHNFHTTQALPVVATSVLLAGLLTAGLTAGEILRGHDGYSL